MPRRVGTIIERLLGRHRAELYSGADPVPDAELLTRFARTRDESAFELLVWRHAGMVLGVCRRVTRDTHLAEDAFQATFLVLARKAGAIRGGNVAGWLFRVARRAGSRAVRFRSVMVPLPDVPAPIGSDAYERSELASLIDEEIGRLPERLRLPVVLCYLGGRTTEDAARELGCPRGTVLSRLATARNRLAARLSRRGVTLPAAGIGIGVLPAEVTTAAALVQRTVQTGLAFTAGRAATGPAVTLAEGMVRAMTITKLATLVGVFALGIGVTTGMGLVAAQGTKPANNGTSVVAAEADPQVKTQPPASAEVERQKKLDQLVRHADELAVRIEKLQQELLRLNPDMADVVNITVLQAELHDLEKAIYQRQEQIPVEERAIQSLQKQKADELKQGPVPGKSAYTEAVASAPEVKAAAGKLTDATRVLNLVKANAPPGSPVIDAAQKEVENAEAALKATREAALPKLVEIWRTLTTERYDKQIVNTELQRDKASQDLERLIARQRRLVERIQTLRSQELKRQGLLDELNAIRDVRQAVLRQKLLLEAGLEKEIAILPTNTGTVAPDARVEVLQREIAGLREEIEKLKRQKK